MPDNMNRASGALSAEEREEVEERVKLRPLAIYEVVRQEGIEELRRPLGSLWWSGLAAGVSIGFSVLAEGALTALLPEARWTPLLASWGYSVGFLIVILARQQLFTEITLTAMLPVLSQGAGQGWRGGMGALARLWSVVFLANMAGTLLFALGLQLAPAHAPWLREGALAVARHLAEMTPIQAFLRAIISGWMIATLVWVLPMAEAAKFWVIALITYLIALFDLSHVVAGSVEIFLLVTRGDMGPGQALLGFVLPMLAGNVIGGGALFAILAYGQVRREMQSPPEDAR